MLERRQTRQDYCLMETWHANQNDSATASQTERWHDDYISTIFPKKGVAEILCSLQNQAPGLTEFYNKQTTCARNLT